MTVTDTPTTPDEPQGRTRGDRVASAFAWTLILGLALGAFLLIDPLSRL